MRFTKKSRSYLVGLLLGAVVLVLVVRSWDAQRLLDGIKMLR